MNLILSCLNFLPTEILTLIVAAMPIPALPGAIPLAIGAFGFSPVKSLILAWAGNLFPAALLLWWLGPISDFLSRHFVLAQKFFDWLFAHTRQKFSERYETLGEIALVVFVAIPLPFTGVITGAVASFLFGLPRERSLGLLGLGAAITGLAVTIFTLGVIKIF